jgi:hypothetical protein
MPVEKPVPQPLAYIHATGGIGHSLAADQAPPSLRDAAKQRFGPSLRQASRFVELALLGVDACLESMPSRLPSTTPLYVATGLGEVQKTMSLFATVTGTTPEPAAPFDFINAANNTAGFYVAKHYTGCGRNFTICDGDISFESALSLALWECRHAPCVLVGGVDEAIASRSEYARRNIHADANAIGEGSYWFLLSSQAGGAIGEVLLAEIVADGPADTTSVDAWAANLARVVNSHAPTDAFQLLPGAGLNEQHTAALTRHLNGPIEIKKYSINSNTYLTSSARTLSHWLSHTPGHAPANSDALHVGRDGLGRTALTLVRRSHR